MGGEGEVGLGLGALRTEASEARQARGGPFVAPNTGRWCHPPRGGAAALLLTALTSTEPVASNCALSAARVMAGKEVRLPWSCAASCMGGGAGVGGGR